jgi:hypothetical protein
LCCRSSDAKAVLLLYMRGGSHPALTAAAAAAAAVAAGALAVLYVANAVLDAIERVPLIPPTFKLVGFGFSTWFFFR